MLKKITILIITCLFAMTALSGCSIIAEQNEKSLIENALQERYSEEFVCMRTWNNAADGYYSHSFYGLCYPKNNESLLFEVLSGSDGDLIIDEYTSTLASRIFVSYFDQIIDNNLGEHYTYCYNYGIIYDEIAVPKFETNEFSLEIFHDQNINQFNDNKLTLYYTICVNTSTQHEDAAKEYKAIANAMEHIYEIGKSYDMELELSFDIYFLDDDVYSNCVDYIQNNAILRSEFCEIVDGKPHLKHECVIQIELTNGTISLDEKEYTALRKEFY